MKRGEVWLIDLGLAAKARPVSWASYKRWLQLP
jgi:hypothetical protein